MERFERNKTFLDKIVESKSRQRNQLLSKATEDQLTSILEVCINIHTFSITKADLKKVKPCKVLITKLKRRKSWTKTSMKKLLIQYSKYLPSLISIVVSKVVEGTFCGMLLNDG